MAAWRGAPGRRKDEWSFSVAVLQRHTESQAHDDVLVACAQAGEEFGPVAVVALHQHSVDHVYDIVDVARRLGYEHACVRAAVVRHEGRAVDIRHARDGKNAPRLHVPVVALTQAACCALMKRDFVLWMCRFMPKRPTLSALAIPCLLYTSPSPRDLSTSRMPSSA